MDPLSIIAFAGSVTKVVYQVSTTLYTFVQATRVVDQTVQSLCAEVDGISRMLDGISASLRSPSLATARLVVQNNENNENNDLWDTVLGSLIDCHGTLERLHTALDGIREKPSSGPSWLKQSNRQLKLNLHDDEVRTYRSQLHTHNMTLQITLQMINVHVSCSAPELVVAELGPKLQLLVDMVSKLDSKHNGMESGGQLLDVGEVRTLCGTDQLKRSAKRIISSASTVYSASIAGSEFEFSNGSEYGEPLTSANMSRIQHWIPTAIVEEEVLQTPSAPLATQSQTEISVFSDTRLSVPTDITTPSIHTDESVIAWSDSESEFEFEIIEKLLSKAENKYTQEDFAGAETSFRKALKRVDRLPMAKRSLPRFKNSQMKLAITCYNQDKVLESQALFQTLTMEQARTNNDAIRILQASHFLAQIFLTEKKFTEAESYSRKAMLGRRRIHGKGDCSYLESIALLSIIYKAKGDTEEAAIYEDMVPKEHEVLLRSLQERFLPKLFKTTSTSESTLIIEHPTLLSTSEEPLPSPILRNTTPPPVTFSTWSLKPEDESHDTWKEVISESRHTSPEYESPPPTVQVCIKPATQAILNELMDEPVELVRKEIHSVIRALPGYDNYVWGDDVMQLLIRTSLIYQDSPRMVLQLLRDWTVAQIRQSKHPINNYGLIIDPTFFEHTRAHGLGRNALNHAALRGRLEIVALLLSVGASIDNIDYVGRTPLHCAAMYNEKDVIRLLLDEGADLNKKCTVVGDTPLQYAIARKHDDVVHFLLDAGAQVRTTNLFGESPLHYAAQLGLKDICRQLLRKGSDPRVKDKRGHVPVDYVKEDKELMRDFAVLGRRFSRKAL
ncbi:hypothetical protein MMC27_006243 [Xylographa pallens]|nr:hypothetical protein [Xylographa pallens]